MKLGSTLKLGLFVAIAPLAAGCDRQPAATPPSNPAAASPAPTPAPPPPQASIIRPDVELAEEEAPPLTELQVTIGFPDGGAALGEAAEAELDKALTSPQMKAGGAITLGGHSDSGGTDAANLRIAKKRADAVRDWLTAHGVTEDRIRVIAFGEQNPVAPNAAPDGSPNEAGRARNRRVEITVAPPASASPAPEASETGTLVEEITRE